MSYTVFGATVNLAARLEALNKDYGTEILVSEAVRERVADRFTFNPVDMVRPKGLREAAVSLRIGSMIRLKGEAPKASPSSSPTS